MIVRHRGNVVADIPAAKLANEAPIYPARSARTRLFGGCAKVELDAIAQSKDPVADLKTLLAWPSIASKDWVYRQYDHMVRDCAGGGTGFGRGGVAHQNRFTATLAVGPRGERCQGARVLRSRWIAMRVTFTSILTKVEKIAVAECRAQSRLFRSNAPQDDGQSEFWTRTIPKSFISFGSRCEAWRRPVASTPRLQAGTSVFIIKSGWRN